MKGRIDFTEIWAPDAMARHFEKWESVVDVLEYQEMPPEDEPQLTDSERETFFNWYQVRFVDSIEPSPGVFQPRRLSVTEYRNTMRSLFGFELEFTINEAEQTLTERSLVKKLLPTDPPGRSGFTNDTHGNPLTTEIWDQYSFLVDSALGELFSSKRLAELEKWTGPIDEKGIKPSQAEKLLRGFIRRAFRREVNEQEMDVYLAGLRDSDKLVRSLKREMKAVLMSPRFLYRGLLVEKGEGQQRVDPYELAERLSYFLWADMPDEQLFKLAGSGTLEESKTFEGQIDRMLKSPKARSLAEDLGVQWLALDEIDQTTKQLEMRAALKDQPIEFLHYIFTENRPVIELIDSTTEFINPHLAKYYGNDRKQLPPYRKQKGIEREIVPVHRITLKDSAGTRGGILTMPGVVWMNKGPVIRGTWMLERIMGEHLGEPPPDVGQVPSNPKGKKLTFRERFEMHRAKATCAVCHDKIDPLVRFAKV